MPKKLFSNKKSIQRKLFLSFLSLALLLSFLISIFAYLFSYGFVKKRVSESFSLTLDYIETNISYELEKIYDLTDYIFTNQTIKNAIVNYNINSPESIALNADAADTIKQYAISQFYTGVDSITIVGFNGYKLQHFINYVDVLDDGMSIYYNEWSQQAIDAKGQRVWHGLVSRKLNPLREDSAEITEAILFRTIKNKSYTEDIGLIYVSLNSRFFLNHIKEYKESYPSYAEQSQLLILDNHNNVINYEDNNFSEEELTDILGSSKSQNDEGYSVASQNCIAFVKEFDGWHIIGTVPSSFFTARNSYLFYMSVISFLLSIFICGLIWLYVSSGIFRPIHKIAETVKRIEGGESTLRINVNSRDEIGQLGSNLNNMLERIDELNKENLDKELKMRDAIHRACQAQINPHFIYNTLNSIRWLAVMINADSITKAIDAFWQIAKYNTNSKKDYFSTIEKEVEIVKKYVYLQKLSYVNKFDVQWDISDEALKCTCIKFILQPLVENAIIHGAFPRNEECLIYISAYCENDQLVLNVYDTGMGMDKKTLKTLNDQLRHFETTGHIGLLNILERLHYVYDNNYHVDISSEKGQYTNIMIKTPLTYQQNNGSGDYNDKNNDC